MSDYKILPWIFQTSKIAVLLSRRHPNFKTLVKLILEETSDNKQVLLIDFENRVAATHITPNTIILQPRNIKEHTNLLLSLEQRVTHNVQLLVVLGLPTYLRDYIHKSARKNTVNNRIFALSLSILEGLSHTTQVLVHSYRSEIKPEKSVYANIVDYYINNQMIVDYKKNAIILSKPSDKLNIIIDL